MGGVCTALSVGGLCYSVCVCYDGGWSFSDPWR